MGESLTYQVISNGELQPGFELLQVQSAFADLFKVPLEQAQKVVGCKTVIKKNIDHSKAELYKQRLEKIGMVVTIQSIEPEVTKSTFASLALEPIEGEESSSSVPSQNISAPSAKPSSVLSICPKCGLQQPKTNECSGCGIFFDKYQKRVDTETPVKSRVAEKASLQHEEANTAVDETPEDVEYADKIIPKAILGAAAAALAGALAWMLIAVTFGYELGIIAWGIGGLVGFAAAKLGSRGDYSAAICGVLALLAIVGGKYMVLESYKSQLADILSENYAVEEYQDIYDEEMLAAQAYVANVDDDKSLRQFMVEYEYTEFYEPEEITDEEVQAFNELTAPSLKEFAYNVPTIDEWKDMTFSTVQAEISGMSTLDLMAEDFSWIDLLFYFLGISTAYRLARG